MRYIKLSFKYLTKNFLFLFLVSLLPSVFLGAFLSPFKFLEFVNNYSNLTVSSFNDIFYSIIDISWLKILFYVISFGLIGIFVSVIIGEIENHFRSGKRNYLNFKHYINNNILAVLLNMIAFAIINFVVSFLCGTIIYIFHILLCGLNTTPKTWSLIVAILLFTIYFCVVMLAGLTLSINVPNMTYNGYNFKQAIFYTINLIGQDLFNLILGFLVPFVAIVPLISIFSFSSLGLRFVGILCVLIAIIYYSSFVMTSFYSLSGINRYDERKYFQMR